MKKPVEMTEAYAIELHDGRVATTLDVWEILNASFRNDFDSVKQLAERNPGLLTCQFDYTSPLHFAVREGHFDLVRFFVDAGALDPGYSVHPFMDPLLMIAEERGLNDTAVLLKQSLEDPTKTFEWGDTGKVDFARDETRVRFEQAVDQGNFSETKAMLEERPDLALDKLAFWGEGILAMPAKDNNRSMLELLLEYGATVPEMSKWGARYYFKHYETATFLLENGMNPNHMNWREFTLLHDMAHTGDVEKARLLIDHAADINAVDEEYCSTPLGYAVRWGHREMVSFLLEHGADPNISGASWATPMSWAVKKGHNEIVADLKSAGAM